MQENLKINQFRLRKKPSNPIRPRLSLMEVGDFIQFPPDKKGGVTAVVSVFNKKNGMKIITRSDSGSGAFWAIRVS